MKKLFLLGAMVCSFFLGTVAHGQDVNTCKPIAERILTAAQNHTPDGIDELLASEFHYNNVKQPTAAKVLKQIIAQMPAMTSWELTGTEQDSTRLTLRYIITKPDSTTSEATILFRLTTWCSKPICCKQMFLFVVPPQRPKYSPK
jgi:hypothetical protein